VEEQQAVKTQELFSLEQDKPESNSLQKVHGQLALMTALMKTVQYQSTSCCELKLHCFFLLFTASLHSPTYHTFQMVDLYASIQFKSLQKK
jgi:hypothetical protein